MDLARQSSTTGRRAIAAAPCSKAVLMHPPMLQSSTTSLCARTALSTALAACLLLQACGGEEGRPAAPPSGTHDAGRSDAGTGPRQHDDADGGHVISSGETELCTYQDSDRFV